MSLPQRINEDLQSLSSRKVLISALATEGARSRFTMRQMGDPARPIGIEMRSVR